MKHQKERFHVKYFSFIKFLLVAILSGVVLGELCVFILINHSPKKFTQQSPSPSLQQMADQVITTCAHATRKSTCYEKVIPNLMDTISMEDAFKVSVYVQQKDTSYTYCHVLGHNLSAKETEKNPNAWQEVVARCPSGVCSNGCIHGAFQQRFRAESFPDAKLQELIPVLQNTCEPRGKWNPTQMEQASCYHALGHLTMYITAGNIDTSTRLCEILGKKSDGRDYVQLCYDGAFMQIFQPLEPEDFALVKGKQPTKEGLKIFCSQYQDQKRSSCWTEGWPLMFDELKKPQGLINHCRFLSGSNQESRCYMALMDVLTAQFNFDSPTLIQYCSEIPETFRAQCFANVASRFIETDWRMIDKSVSICKAAEQYYASEKCYDELVFFSSYNFHKGSEEQKNLCNKLPEVWKSKCS
jgi:hypothetical protein